MTRSTLKPLVLSAAVAAAVAVLGAPAHALDAKISGQVNRAIMFVDNGEDSDTLHVDGDNSSTRVRFTGSEDIQPGLKAGITWEVELQSNASDQVDVGDRGGQGVKADNQSFAERWMEVWFQGSVGKLSVGQGDGAMNGGVEVDLSGTSVASYAGTRDIGGGVNFRDSITGARVAKIGDVISQQDFESRYDRVRYDTPSFGGFSVAVSTGTANRGSGTCPTCVGGEDIQEYGLRYNGDLGGGNKLAGAIGISSKDVGSNNLTGSKQGDRETTGGSISLLLASGLNFTLGATNVEDDGPSTVGGVARDSDFTYFKIGYKSGMHAVSLDAASADDQGTVKNEADHVGIQYVWSPQKWAELYAAYKTVSLDRPAGAASVDDIDILLIGSRIKF